MRNDNNGVLSALHSSSTALRRVSSTLQAQLVHHSFCTRRLPRECCHCLSITLAMEVSIAASDHLSPVRWVAVQEVTFGRGRDSAPKKLFCACATFVDLSSKPATTPKQTPVQTPACPTNYRLTAISSTTARDSLTALYRTLTPQTTWPNQFTTVIRDLLFYRARLPLATCSRPKTFHEPGGPSSFLLEAEEVSQTLHVVR